YPSLDEEDSMLQRLQRVHPIDELSPVVAAADILACQQAVREVFIDEKVRRYLLQIVQETRQHDDVLLGASPRASLALYRTTQALAAIHGRDFVLPDDVKQLAPAVLEHRLILKPESRLRKQTAARVVREILDEVPVPVLKGAEGPDYFKW